MISRAPVGQEPADRAARAAARRLAPELGDRLPGDVEALLRGPGTRPTQYVDPVSIAALVVAAAQLTWTVVTDLRKRRQEHDQDSVVAAVAGELPAQPASGAAQHRRIVEVVVEETLEQPARDAHG